MADKTIDQADEVTSASGSEYLPASLEGAAKKISTATVKSYVMAAVAALTDAEDWGEESTDRLVVKQNGANKNLTVDDLVGVVFDALTGKTAADELTDADVISIKNNSAAKTTTLGAIKTYISDAFSGNMAIHSLTPADSAASTDELAAYQTPTDGTAGNRKVTVEQLATAICPKVAALATQSTDAIASTDGIIIDRATTSGGVTTHTLQRVPLQNSGLPATSSVSGPDETTVGKIPQWNSTDRALKDGLTLVDGVSSGSLDTQVPTAKAVYDAVSEKVSGPDETTVGKIPQWNSTDGALKDGLTLVDIVADGSLDTHVPTAKAVYDAVSAKVSGPSLVTAGDLVRFSGTTGRSVIDGIRTTDSVSSSSTNAQVPTARAVYGETSKAVQKPSSTTTNNIPQWSNTDGAIKDGLEFSTSIEADSTDTEVASAKAVYDFLVSAMRRYVSGATLTSASNDGEIPIMTVVDPATGEIFPETSVGSTIAYQNSGTLVSSATTLPTSSVVKSYVDSKASRIEVVGTIPVDGQEGYEQGAVLLCTLGSARKLYVNVGTSSSATWVKFTED